MDQETGKEFAEIKRNMAHIQGELDDIKDNHLQSIYASIEFILRDISNLRWYIMGGIGILAIVVTLIQCFG
jgi:hypothetical protein